MERLIQYPFLEPYTAGGTNLAYRYATMVPVILRMWGSEKIYEFLPAKKGGGCQRQPSNNNIKYYDTLAIMTVKALSPPFSLLASGKQYLSTTV